MPSATRGRESLVSFASKPRVFILTDITNEPDDAQSFCRYVTYANQFHTEGVVATTSVWLRNKVAPEGLHRILDGYEKVVDNLNAHAHPDWQYPTVETLKNVVRGGAPVFGMLAVGDDIPLSDGGELLLERLTAPDQSPLWVIVWGGVNVLAQVLFRIRNRPDATQLRHKLRVYTISDQDDSGAWIRQQWLDIFYICSVHGWNQYDAAAWRGISSDNAGEKGGPDPSKITNEWIRENIQISPLGAEYPDVEYSMEGDTPTFLYLIQNGLGVPDEPSYGSWGGRLCPYQPQSKGCARSGTPQ
ncbi:cellulose-binding [Fusarium albosuccineum]|uniref:Cellulose-binding n=1 Tax=Fusarium albosuccineum TaxID=1237068 RepID=A0A8H4P925_9HYPO|nr:cellulose-binding [Fusarium albosuccineum]